MYHRRVSYASDGNLGPVMERISMSPRDNTAISPGASHRRSRIDPEKRVPGAEHSPQGQLLIKIQTI